MRVFTWSVMSSAAVYSVPTDVNTSGLCRNRNCHVVGSLLLVGCCAQPRGNVNSGVFFGDRSGAGIMEVDDRQMTSPRSPTVIPPSTLDERSLMKRYPHRQTCSHTSSRRSPKMVMLLDTRFVECRRNDGWTVKTVVT